MSISRCLHDVCSLIHAGHTTLHVPHQSRLRAGTCAAGPLTVFVPSDIPPTETPDAEDVMLLRSLDWRPAIGSSWICQH